MEYFKIVLQLFGGLGIFLYGMFHLSNGMQKIAGDRLKKILAYLTGNRIFGIIMGVFITGVLQSSSVVTVMTVGFVNASLLNLQQALGVILGANIGTTITGWILVLKVGEYGLPIAGIAAMFFVFLSSEKAKARSLAIMGLGLVFFGLELMSSGLKPIRHMPEFVRLFHSFDVVEIVNGVKIYNYSTVIKAAMIGMAMTAVVQSSSATLGITIALAIQGLLNYETAVALVLGENIGTTITAFLASLKANANARRAAYAHILINVVGVIWVISIFGFFIFLLSKVAPPPEGLVENLSEQAAATYKMKITKAIAMAHTLFNVTNVILFTPFIGYLAKLLNYVVKDDVEAQTKRVTHLDELMADVPSLVMGQTKTEILTMGKQIETCFKKVEEIYSDRSLAKEHSDFVEMTEEKMDLYEKEITDANFAILHKSLDEDDVEETRENLMICDEYETISDYQLRIAKTIRKMVDNDIFLDGHRKNTVMKFHKFIEEIFIDINNAYKNRDKDLYVIALKKCNEVKGSYKKARNEHFENIHDEKAMFSTGYMDILNNYRRIKDHMYAIIETTIKIG
ncbi:MAG: Na/Pi cotransporter family protein [Fusobacteriaceae bacterium]